MKNALPMTAVTLSIIPLVGCSTQQPQTMAPPVNNQPMMSAPAGMPAQGAPQSGTNNVWSWQDVPQNQNIPITRAVFDQGGYQLYATSGETITVPFANQNMYVMKFGKTSGQMYFVNEAGAPTLYVPNGGYLENAAAQGAHWYPFPNNFAYTRPVYMGLAPTWGDYVAMGWYPGMMYYGGYWGYNPWRVGLSYSPMPGLYVNIGGHPYYGWNSYHTYYRSTPYNRVVINSRPSFSYNSVGRRAPGTGSFGRSSGSTGSFGRTRSTGSGFSASRPGSSSFGRTSGSTGAFGRSSGSSSSFGRSTNFGTSSNRPTFGSGSSSSSGSSFGRSSGFGSSSSSSSFGRPSSSSTFGRSSSFGGSSSGRSSSFGGTSSGRSSSFGGSSSGFSSGRSSSFGSSSSSFGRSSSSGFRSSGGSFGGRRR